MAENMDWAEIKMRLRDGASVQVLADLNAVTYKTMYNRIMAHQVKDGVEYLTPRNTKGMLKSKAISKTKQAQAKAKEKKAAQKSAERPEVQKPAPLPAIDFADLCRGDMPINMDMAVRKALGKPADACCHNCKWEAYRDNKPYCWRGHNYEPAALCSEYEKYIPEKKPDIPEEIKNADMVTIKGIRVEGARDIPDEVYTVERRLMPETLEEIRNNFLMCHQLADRYKKQAEDWKRILDAYGKDWDGAQGLPEV